MADSHTVSSGVQELISRLKDEGVQAGRQEADRIVAEARERAEEIVSRARRESEEMREKTRREIASEREACHESLRVAIRDTELTLESHLKSLFARHVKRLVCQEIQAPDFLREVILRIVDSACGKIPESTPVDILVSDEHFEAEGELKTHMQEFILGITSDMLCEGVELKPAGDRRPGIRIRMGEEDVEIDLSGDALSDLLLRHLLPRYRAIVSGVE